MVVIVRLNVTYYTMTSYLKVKGIEILPSYPGNMSSEL